MVSTKTFLFYLMFILIFNLFVGGFGVNADENEKPDIDIKKSFITTQVRDKIITWGGLDKFKPLQIATNIVAIPFIILESLLYVIYIIGLGFTILPPIIEILLLTPLGIMVILDYVVPAIRGN